MDRKVLKLSAAAVAALVIGMGGVAFGQATAVTGNVVVGPGTNISAEDLAEQIVEAAEDAVEDLDLEAIRSKN